MKKQKIIILFFLLVNYLAANSQTTPTDSQPIKYAIYDKATALNTNFILPGLRYNLRLKTTNPATDKGTLEYFNSAGAGIGVSFGRMKMSTKDRSKIDSLTNPDNIDIEMKNHFSINFGFLFSQNNIDSIDRSIFAPVLSLGILNFQFGAGYELGTVSADFSRFFFTVTYDIPLQKFTDSGSLLLSKINYSGNKKSKQTNLYFF